jgi:hypothetical protein
MSALKINSSICPIIFVPSEKEYNILKLPSIKILPKLRGCNSITNVCAITWKIVKNR